MINSKGSVASFIKMARTTRANWSISNSKATVKWFILMAMLSDSFGIRVEAAEDGLFSKFTDSKIGWLEAQF